MRRPALAAFALAAVLSFTAARAAPFTSAFDGLANELQYRVTDGPLGGTDLTGTAKKQQKAATKVLAQFAKTTDDVADDLKSLKIVEKKLRKPFQDEFDPAGPDGTVGALLGDASDSLLGLLAGRRDALESRVSDLPPGDANKVQKAIDAFDRYAPRAAPPNAVKKRAPALLKLYAAVRAGEKVAGTGGGGTGTNLISARIDGVLVTSDVTTPAVDRGDGTLLLALVQILPSGETTQISFAVKGVTGPGEYLLDDPDEYALVLRFGGTTQGTYELVDETGVVTFTEFDLATPRIVASFSFDVQDFAKTTTVRVTEGVADFRRVTVVGDGPACSPNGNTGSALVDSQPFTPNLVAAVQIQRILEISASDGTSVVSLFVSDFDGVGTYQVVAGSSYSDMGGTRTYAATGGSVTVTEYDPLAGRLAGTYTLDAALPPPASTAVQVRQGTFCVSDLAIGR
mgnify:CR=1 FL=1